MESRGTTKMSKRAQKTILQLILLIPLAAVLVALLLINLPRPHHHQPLAPTLDFPLHPFIKKACSETLYSSLCHSTLSNMTVANEFASFVQIFHFTINRTVENVGSTRNRVEAHFKNQDLNSHEKNALGDCMELLDQTAYELQEVIKSLRSIPEGYLRSRYGDLRTLLSAAMTNENTCIDGFLDLEELHLDSRKGHREHLQTLLTPISQLISNSLGLIKYAEREQGPEIAKKPGMMKITKRRVAKFPTSGKIIRGRNKAIIYARPHVTVSTTARGGYRTVGDAIAGAPNMSRSIYVIKVMAGVYPENVMVPREKSNIILIGDGMNSTIITGSRSFADGFSTFASATLTVIGDRFMARDLTIINAAGPDKHQAVALRVTSNAAFYRCEIISHQDTLYAHSLRQFYQNCSIQGTVDFIFGNAAAVFHHCKILVRKPTPGQRNMITAQGREDPNQNTGISLQNCTIEATAEFNLTERKSFQTYLGRPWRNYSRTVVMDSYLGDLINPRGWCEWDQFSTLDTVEYIEYRNFGPGADTTHRITWPGYRKNCTEDVAKHFSVQEFLHDADDWLQSTVFPLIARVT